MTETAPLIRLGLGTAQFGSDYGISNRHGHPPNAEIRAILACTVGSGIRYVDTATTYANAEALLGRHLPPDHRMRIVTKADPVNDLAIEPRHGRRLIDGLRRSLDRLKIERMYGLLVHRVSDLAKAGAEHLVDALIEAKNRNLVSRIGISIYDADELTLAERRFSPEIVQVPLNVLDQRLIDSGTLGRLKMKGAEIHARSVFLQGLLLMDPTTIPEFFETIRGQIADLQTHWARSGLRPLAGCLAFVFDRPEIDVAIVGVNRRSELEEIKAAVASIGDRKSDVPAVLAVNPIYLNPSSWPVRLH